MLKNIFQIFKTPNSKSEVLEFGISDLEFILILFFD